MPGLDSLSLDLCWQETHGRILRDPF